LYRDTRGRLEWALALVTTAGILFAIANLFPVVGIEAQGTQVNTTLYGAVAVLWGEGMPLVAGLVFATTILAPALELGILFFLLAAVRVGHIPRTMAPLLKLMMATESWSMIEVFMLGLLVSVVKLSHLATILPGIALWAYAALMMTVAAISATVGARDLWPYVPLHSR
jgi:paraquat-inducible protein A